MGLKVEEQKILYRELLTVYELADEMLRIFESSNSKTIDAEFKLAEPLIKQIGESTDIITEKYIEYLEGGKKNQSLVKELETAIRKVFISIDQFVKTVNAKYC